MAPEPRPDDDAAPPVVSDRRGEVVPLIVPVRRSPPRVAPPSPHHRLALATGIVTLTVLAVAGLRLEGAARVTYRHAPRAAPGASSPTLPPVALAAAAPLPGDDAPRAGPFATGPAATGPATFRSVASALAAPAPQSVLAQPPPLAAASADAAGVAARRNPLAAPAMVFDASAPSTAPGAGDGAGDGAGNAIVAPQPQPPAAPAAPARAAAVVTQGTLIPAVLETAIAGSAPGFVRAVVAADVRSSDGTRVLVQRSSRLVGEFRDGPGAGRSRAYVIWTRLIRPDGTAIAIAPASAAVDPDEPRFLARFSAAPLLSVVGAAHPGGRVRPGEPVRVLAAHDLALAPSR